MANKNPDLTPEEEEQIENQWRGTVVDETLASPYRNLAIAGGLFFCMIVGCLIFFLSQEKSKEEQLEEVISNYNAISGTLSELSSIVHNPNITSRELRRAVLYLIELSKTNLRHQNHPQKPYIVERELSLIAALEGMLRLEIEEMIDIKSDSGLVFYQTQLDRIGSTTLEYYENSIIESIPLIKQSKARLKIKEIKTHGHTLEHEIIALEEKLTQIKKEESFTVVSAAYMLGKWFRFHNDLDNAKQCFEIGRRYIEGYQAYGNSFSGKRPNGITPVWIEYVGCLESLAEIALLEGKVRVARSYLTRMLNTPNQIYRLFNPLSTKGNFLEEKKVESLEHDIKVYRLAIRSPLNLGPFPFFSIDNSHIKWALLQEELADGALSPKTNLSNYIYSRLDESLQIALKDTKTFQWSEERKKQCLETLNEVVKDDNLILNVKNDFNSLSQLIHKTFDQEELSIDELYFLNRDIIDNQFNHIFPNAYVLSDGLRLHNRLNLHQKAFLIDLYETALSSETLSDEKKKKLQQSLQKIHQNTNTPTLQELHTVLLTLKKELKQSLKEIHAEIQHQRVYLKTLITAIQELEAPSQNKNFQKISQIQTKETNARERLLQLRGTEKQLRYAIRDNQLHFRELTLPFQKTLQRFNKQLSLIKQEQDKSFSKVEKWEDTLLSQIDQQLLLKEKYIFLLQELKEKGENQTLLNLHQQYLSLEEQTQSLEIELEQSSGEEREQREQILWGLKEKKYTLLAQLNTTFIPIREVTNAIAKHEKKTLMAEKDLWKTREEIFNMIGFKDSPGSLIKKTKQRKNLLLIPANKVLTSQGLEKEIYQINQEIANDQASLNVLLEKESIAKSVLETFFPDTYSNHKILKDEKGFNVLNSYLIKQEKLHEHYKNMWEAQQLLIKIYSDYSLLIHTFASIDEELQYPNLNEQQIIHLNRYLHTLIDTRKKLRYRQYRFAHLEKYGHQDLFGEAIGERGYFIDQLERFQIEFETGLDTQHYLEIFENRQKIVLELNQAIGEKDGIQNKMVHAVQFRNQSLIDTLTPKLSEMEQIIQALSDDQERLNEQLRSSNKRYLHNFERLTHFRKLLPEKIQTLEKNLLSYSQRMSKVDHELQDLSSRLIGNSQEIHHSFTEFQVEDLEKIEQFIAKSKEEFEHLRYLRNLKVNEQYFHSKAKWLIAQSYYQQSLMDDLDLLKSSQEISFEMLEEEKLNSIASYPEFDESYAYSLPWYEDNDFSSEEMNLQTWRHFLEEQVLKICKTDLPNSALTQQHPPTLPSNIDPIRREDLKTWISKSQFLSGEIHLHRAVLSMETGRKQEILPLYAQQELSKAMELFNQYLNFALSLEDEENLMTEPTPFSQEFPFRSRQKVNLSYKANIYLGIIADLTKNYSLAIKRYREVIADITKNYMPEKLKNSFLGQLDPIITESFSFHTQLHPIFASLIAFTPSSSEALYRLGKSYEQLYSTTTQSLKNQTPPYLLNSEEKIQSTQEYALKALSYYSQLILGQSYSTYRKAALLRRALLYKKLGYYHNARNDLIALGGFSTYSQINPTFKLFNEKGDKLLELYPTKPYVLFELGKLHMQYGEYTAAALAFSDARMEDPEEGFVLEARIAYAESLIELKQWLKANFFIKELIKEKRFAPKEDVNKYHLDLYLFLGQSYEKLGNLQEAIKSYQSIWTYLPGVLIKEDQLNLNAKDGIRILSGNYRDFIRPLTLSCLSLGKLYLKNKKFAEAKNHFQKAETLARLIPWKQDRLLRKFTRKEFREKKDEWILLSKWGQLKSDANELLFGSLEYYRSQLENPKLKNTPNPFEERRQLLDKTLKLIEGQRTDFQILTSRIEQFKKYQNNRLPEVIEREYIRKKRELNRIEGNQKVIEYDRLANLREFVLGIEDKNTTEAIKQLLLNFSTDTISFRFLEDFSLEYSQRIIFSSQELRRMLTHQPTLENLLILPQLNTRFKEFAHDLRLWIERKMRSTGIDDLFIPVSLQKGILTEIDLYLVSLYSHAENPTNFNKLTAILETYITEMKQTPNRINNPDALWQMFIIGSMTAEYVGQWNQAISFHRLIIESDWKSFALETPVFDLKMHQLGLAKALIQEGKRTLSELIFVQDDEIRIEKEQKANRQMDEAETILTLLKESTDSHPLSVAARLQAKELLKELGV